MASFLKTSLILLLFGPFLLISQENLTKVDLRKSLDTEWEVLKSEQGKYLFQNKIWAYLRFCEVPTSQQQEIMESFQIERFQYQPDLQWMASIPLDISSTQLELAGICSVSVASAQTKMDSRIFYNRIPDYAYSDNGYRATVIVAATGQYKRMKSAIEQNGAILKDVYEPLGFISVVASQKALRSIAALPFVIYVELPEPPAELEYEDEMTLSRGAFINGYYSLNGLNGEGIKIAVNEGGIIDTLIEPDFKNRSDRRLEQGTVSGHKTGVGSRMASAGNINPIYRGQAWGAELVSGGVNFTTAAQNNINIVNNSFGYGCIPAGSTYNSGAATNDYLVRTRERFMITYSSGNIGNSTCSTYGAGQGWGNITGLVKSAKNIFAVGAMNTDDQLTNFSSRGPAMDGRILPDITAPGPGGTSHASPNLAGVNAQLTQSYRNTHSNQWPNSGLIKAIILNTADDIENPGPDYKSGFGRLNASRALEVINNSQFISDSVAHSSTKTHAISVPSGVSQLKVSLYWNDREATAGIKGKTLVNNLDLRLRRPNNSWVQPWVLNPFPNADSLNQWAKRGIDTLNNVELITIDNPASGTYTPEVKGTLVPYGPQVYRVVYSFVYDSIKVIYPSGGESLVPKENRRIRWDAYDTAGTFDIQYSLDSGNTWRMIAAGLAGKLRSYNWSIPDSVSGNCFVKVTSGSLVGHSNSRFSIVYPPNNLHLVWRCADSAMVSWDTVPGALGYRVYKLGTKYMDTLLQTSIFKTTLYNLSSTNKEWISVQTMMPDGGVSRRTIALSIDPTNVSCVPFDLSLNGLLSPTSGYHPSCLTADSLSVEIILKNQGVKSLAYLPVAFQVNNGAIMRDTLFTSLGSAAEAIVVFPKAVLLATGNNTIRAWATYPGDGNRNNDTLETSIIVIAGSSGTIPYAQTFDNFTNCSTAWGCASITCNLAQGWFNVPNVVGIDSIDWRTKNGSTGTGGTGPSGDHTSGNGKYLYLEGSGNNGSGCTNKEAKAYSPCFDLTGTNNPTISYWYHAYGSAIGSLHMDVLANGKWHLDVAPVVSGAQGNQWFQQKASLKEFEGMNVVARFRGTTGNGFTSDLAIDDMNLITLPLANHETVYDTFCLQQQVTWNNLSTYGTSYKWSISPNTFTYTSGSSTSANPIVLPTDTGWYSVELIATNVNGSDTLLIPKSFYVTDRSTPLVTTDAPNNTYCFGTTANISVSKKGGTYGFFKDSVLVKIGSDTVWKMSNQNMGYNVYVENYINPTCSLKSAVVDVHVMPDLNGTKLWADDQDLTICAGDTVIIGAKAGLKDYRFYQNTTLVASGPDSAFQSYQLTNGDLVYGEVSDSVGCKGASDSLVWTVNPIPPIPSILAVGKDSLMASIVASSYAWWRDLTPLSDSTQYILAAANGDYEVSVKELGCSSALSSPYTFEKEIIPNAIDEIEEVQMVVFPNPVDRELHVFLNTDGFDHLEVLNSLGKVVVSKNAILGQNILLVDKLASGIYTVRVRGTEGVLEQKILVY